MRRLLLILATTLVTPAALAQMPTGQGPQFGVAVTHGNLDIKFDVAAGVPYRVSGESTGWSAFAGWRFNRYVSIEGSYYDRLDDSGVLAPTTVGLSVKGKAYAASVLPAFPIGDYLSVYARAGYAHWQLDSTFTNLPVPTFPAANLKTQDDGNDLIYGAGVALAFDGGIIRLEYDRLDVDVADVSIWSLGVAWYLGK